MANILLVRIDPDGKETVLEITPVPDSFVGGTFWHSPEHIEEMEKHYKKTGKPKKSYIDVLYVTRRQVEREQQTT